jgi:hypothetical protein
MYALRMIITDNYQFWNPKLPLNKYVVEHKQMNWIHNLILNLRRGNN